MLAGSSSLGQEYLGNMGSETFAEGNEMFGMQHHAFYSSEHQSHLLRKAWC